MDLQLTDKVAVVTGANKGIGLAISEYARAVLCNSLGQYEEALDAAVCASEHRRH